jgi:hypothetical protein
MKWKIGQSLTERTGCLHLGSKPTGQAPWAWFGLTLLLTSAGSFAQDGRNSLSERATLSSARQTRIRAETEKATADLSRIIDEFDRNGLGDEQDAKMLRAVRDTLTRLTDSQMEQVLALLDQARNARSDDAAKTHSASAFAEQQQIYAAMQKTLLAFQQQADLMELSLQFSALANRENANFKATKHLALRSMNARDLDEGKAAELHVQQTEQDSISTEVSARLDKLASLMKAVDPAVAEQLAKATQQVAPAALKQAISSASSELRLAHLTSAASEELSSYRKLREFSRLAKPPREPEQILTDAAEQMAVTIAGYQVVMEETITAHRHESDESRMMVDDEEGDLVDDVSDVSKDVETLAPAAFSMLGVARDMMQEARAAGLGGSDRQQHTLPILIQAREEILDELKRRQRMTQMQDGNNKLERAEAVRDEMTQLGDKQKQIIDETHKAHSDEALAAVAAKQAAVTDALKALSPAAAKELPQAAQAVDNAATTSSQANDRFAENKPREALDPQKQTLDALTNAENQADAAAADLEQKAAELQKLQQTHDDIARIANGEQALAVQTAVAAAQNPQQANPQTPEANPADKNPPAVNAPTTDAKQPAANSPQQPKAQNPSGDPAEKTAATAQPPTTNNQPQANDQNAPAHPAGKTPPATNPPTPDAQQPPATNPPQSNAPAPAPDAGAKNPAANPAKADAPAPKGDSAAQPPAKDQDAANPDAADPLKTNAPTAKQLANDQQNLAQQTQELQAAAAPDTADAAQPLKDAAQQMNDAGKQLNQNAPVPAQQPEQGAIDALKKAQAAVDQKMDRLKQQLGQQPDQNEQMNAAGQEVQQALANTTDAQAAMQEKKGDEAGEKMQGAAGHAAAAEDQGTLPAAAQQAVAQAHQELAKGTAAETGGNEKAAGEHAAAAAGLLQQAMQQIQQAQGNMPGKEPGNQPGNNPAGQKKGDPWKPGQMAGDEPPRGVHPAHVDASGKRDQVAGGSNYNGLPDRDRAGVTQSGSEPAPAQYESMVQEYMRDLADDSETAAKTK